MGAGPWTSPTPVDEAPERGEESPYRCVGYVEPVPVLRPEVPEPPVVEEEGPGDEGDREVEREREEECECEEENEREEERKRECKEEGERQSECECEREREREGEGGIEEQVDVGRRVPFSTPETTWSLFSAWTPSGNFSYWSLLGPAIRLVTALHSAQSDHVLLEFQVC